MNYAEALGTRSRRRRTIFRDPIDKLTKQLALNVLGVVERGCARANRVTEMALTSSAHAVNEWDSEQRASSTVRGRRHQRRRGAEFLARSLFGGRRVDDAPRLALGARQEAVGRRASCCARFRCPTSERSRGVFVCTCTNSVRSALGGPKWRGH